MPKVVIVNEKNKEIEVPQGSNLRQELQKAGIAAYPGIHNTLNCHGLGLCGTCRILVKSGKEHLSPKSTIEKLNLNLHPLTMLAALGREDEMRLCCQVRVEGDCKIETQVSVNWTGENFWQKPYPNK